MLDIVDQTKTYLKKADNTIWHIALIKADHDPRYFVYAISDLEMEKGEIGGRLMQLLMGSPLMTLKEFSQYYTELNTHTINFYL